VKRVLALLFVLTATVAHAGWWEDAAAAKRASLADLRRDPGLWRDVLVSLDVRVEGLVEPGDPCATRFTARDWRAVAATPVDAAASARPYGAIFVRRSSESERRLAAASKDARVVLRVAVRESVRGEPWIEVFDATGDADPLDPEETSLVARADVFLAHDNAVAAEPIYRGLLAARSLPAAIRAELWRKVGAACWSQRRHADAKTAYESALVADPNDADAKTRLAAANAVLAAGATPRNDVDAAANVPAPVVRLLPPSAADDARADVVATTPPTRIDPAAPRPSTSETTPAPVVDAPPAPVPPKPKLAGPK